MNENRTNYINTLCTKINEKLAPAATVYHTLVEKHNDQLLDALRFDIPDVKISPVIYISKILDEMPEIETAADQIIEIYKKSDAPKIDIDELNKNLKSKSWIKMNVLPKLTASANDDDISIPFMDMTISFYVRIDDESTITLKKSHTDLSPEELINFAKINAVTNYKFRGMFETLREMQPNMADLLPGTEDEQTWILSSKNGVFGATAIIDDKILAEIANKLGSNLYILPSSIHECLILKSDFTSDPKALREMVKSVNETKVAPNDYLSDSVFLYIKDKSHLQFA